MFDIELDRDTGDWVLSPHIDLQKVRTDEDVVNQRIWTRLRIDRGWLNDPTNGLLGSRLRKLGTRIPRQRALIEIPLYIDEALAPMGDVTVLDTQLVLVDEQTVLAHITYRVIDPGDPRPLPAQATTTVDIEILLK